MKRIIIGCFIVLAAASTANAQTRQRTTRANATTATDKTVVKQRTSISPAAATTATTAENARVSNVARQATDNQDQRTYPVGNGGIIVPDHAYEPEGTEGVGFFGNGTGGSTIGSTREDGRTGVSGTTGNTVKPATR